MPMRDGAETIRTLRGEFPQERFIVLTVSDVDADRHRCLEARANAVLLKDAPPANLLATIRALANANPDTDVPAGHVPAHRQQTGSPLAGKHIVSVEDEDIKQLQLRPTPSQTGQRR
jgi:DNA-binding NarL/FixJ family response regulator